MKNPGNKLIKNPGQNFKGFKISHSHSPSPHSGSRRLTHILKEQISTCAKAALYMSQEKSIFQWLLLPSQVSVTLSVDRRVHIEGFKHEKMFLI